MSKVRVERNIYVRDGRFFVDVSAGTDPVTGKRRRLTGTVDSLYKARKLRDRLATMVDDGTEASPGRLTFRAYVETRWLPHKRAQAKIRPTTELRYRELLETYVYPAIGSKKLSRVDAMSLQAIVDEMARSHRDSRQAFAVMRAAFAQAVRWKLITHSPAAGVDLPSYIRPRLGLPTRSELERLLGAAGDSREPFRIALTIAAACGLRRSEIAGLRWSDIDSDVIRVERGLHPVRTSEGTVLTELRPKSDSASREVPIPPSVVRMLEIYQAAQAERRLAFGKDWGAGWHADDVLIDRHDGYPMNPDAITRRFQRLRTRLDFPHLRLHDLRALYVTELISTSVDVGLVSKLAGHSDPAFTMRVYQRYRAQDGASAAAALDAALGSALTATGDTLETMTPPTVTPIRRDSSR